VMDADLQQDECMLPAMLGHLRSGELDVVVGSRYVAGGGTGDWNETRKTISRVAGSLAKGLVPENLHDPMSGFFAVRTEAMRDAARRLCGYGYKIPLDLFASAGGSLALPH